MNKKVFLLTPLLALTAIPLVSCVQAPTNQSISQFPQSIIFARVYSYGGNIQTQDYTIKLSGGYDEAKVAEDDTFKEYYNIKSYDEIKKLANLIPTYQKVTYLDENGRPSINPETGKDYFGKAIGNYFGAQND